MNKHQLLKNVKAQILQILKDNNVEMYPDHCPWDGPYIGLTCQGCPIEERIGGRISATEEELQKGQCPEGCSCERVTEGVIKKVTVKRQIAGRIQTKGAITSRIQTKEPNEAARPKSEV